MILDDPLPMLTYPRPLGKEQRNLQPRMDLYLKAGKTTTRRTMLFDMQYMKIDTAAIVIHDFVPPTRIFCADARFTFVIV